MLSKPLFGHWEMACPAQSDEDLKFSRKYSLYNEALFTHVDSSLIFNKEFDGRECDEPYKLSVAFSIETEKLEFGYEVKFLLTLLKPSAQLSMRTQCFRLFFIF